MLISSRCSRKSPKALIVLAIVITFGYILITIMNVNIAKPQSAHVEKKQQPFNLEVARITATIIKPPSTGVVHSEVAYKNASNIKPPRAHVVRKKQQRHPFNSEVAIRYKKYLRPFTPGLDKNCVINLSDKYIGVDEYGDMPIIIPLESEMKSLSLDGIACLYHRYVTSLQTMCASMDRVGEIQRNGWYICADPTYVPRKPCTAFLSNNIFPENIFSEDLKSRYGCDIYKTPLWLKTSLKSWKNEANIPLDGAIDILTLTVNGISNLSLIDRIVNDDSISHVRQLLLELHIDPSHMGIEDYIQVLLRLNELNKQRFRIVWFDRIFQCATSKFNKCYAVYFVQHPLKQERNNEVNLPSVGDIKKMDSTKRADLYFKYVQTTQIFCQNIFRMGQIVDGGWDVCHDHMIRFNHPCIVYSFGVSADLTFDDEVSETYHCDVYSFDQSTAFPTHQHGPNAWFNRIGIGNKHEKFKAGYVAPLQELREMLNHTSSPIDILKIDVEGAEWPSLPNMIKTNQLEDVAQLYLEFHGHGDKENELLVLKMLYDAGFRIFWFHPNPSCLYDKKIRTRSRCMKVYFINTSFKKKG